MIGGVVIGKVTSEVALIRRTKERVAERVRRYVRVGVARETGGVRHVHKTEPELAPILVTEPMYIDTLADSHEASRQRVKVAGLSDLHVGRLARHDNDHCADRLNESSIVGRLVTGVVSALEHVTAKRLRRLDADEFFSRQGLGHDRELAFLRHSLDRVGEGKSRNGGVGAVFNGGHDRFEEAGLAQGRAASCTRMTSAERQCARPQRTEAARDEPPTTTRSAPSPGPS